MLPEQIYNYDKSYLGEYFIDPITGFKFRLWSIEIFIMHDYRPGNHNRTSKDTKCVFRPIDATIKEEYEDEYFFDTEGNISVRIEFPYGFFMVDKDFRYEHGHFCGTCGKACGVTADLESSCCGDAICSSSLLNEETDLNELREYLDEARRTPFEAEIN